MGRFAISFRWAHVTPYDFVRVALAAILLVAAGLKCHQLATSPVVGDGLLDSRWVLMATVAFELFFGLWLLANLLPKWTHRAAVLCFGLFAAVSLCKALAGYDSCGCFGRVEVNPWYTFTLDTAAVLSLLRWRPRGLLSANLPVVPSRAFALRATAVALAWLSIGLPAAVAMGSYRPALLAEDGIILGEDNVVVLEPSKWIGKRFPLLDFIDIGDMLKNGRWAVLLYRHDCPDCREMIEGWSEVLPRSSVISRMVWIEVPPYSDTRALAALSVEGAHGHLSDARKWFVTTPTQLQLEGGVVVAANVGLADASSR